MLRYNTEIAWFSHLLYDIRPGRLHSITKALYMEGRLTEATRLGFLVDWPFSDCRREISSGRPTTMSKLNAVTSLIDSTYTGIYVHWDTNRNKHVMNGE